MNETTTVETKAAAPKRLLLRKYHNITAFTSDDATRFVLEGIHYFGEKKLLEATDGSILIRVPIEESEAFPPVPKLDTLPETNGQDCIIRREPFIKALKCIPKSSMPGLEAVRLDVEAALAPDQPATVHLTTNDLDTINTLTSKAVEGQFPKCDQVIPTEAPKLSICLSREVLGRVCDYARKYGDEKTTGIKFEFTDGLSPVRFTINLPNAQQATGVLMPMRMS